MNQQTVGNQMTNDVGLTAQEKAIHNYIVNRPSRIIYLEELAQFAKDPQNVKCKTIQKTVSEIKRKFKVAGWPDPFANKLFASMAQETLQVTAPAPVPAQTMVQVKPTPDGNMVRVSGSGAAHPAQVDFLIDRLTKSVRTKYGNHRLNDSEWDVFKYLHENVGRLITLSELRDKVVYPQYGSKLPARWFDSIMRIVNNLRRQVVGLDKRLLTVKGAETTYLFQ